MGIVVTLILVGLLLVFAEVLIIPGVGIAGILGLLCMGGACYYAFTQFSVLAGVVVTGVILLLIVLLTIFVLRSKTWKRLTLFTNIDSKAVSNDPGIAVGDRGTAVTRLGPMGTVRVGESVFEAKALEGMIDPETDVEVVLVENGKIYVKPVGEDDF